MLFLEQIAEKVTIDWKSMCHIIQWPHVLTKICIW